MNADNNYLLGFGFFLFILSAMFLVLCVLFLFITPLVGLGALALDLSVMFAGACLFIRGKLGPAVGKVQPCAICKRELPTCKVEFKECRCYFVVRRERSVEENLCWDCVGKVYREFLVTNLKLGWWSMPGLLRTPMMLMFNFVHYLRAKRVCNQLPSAYATSAV